MSRLLTAVLLFTTSCVLATSVRSAEPSPIITKYDVLPVLPVDQIGFGGNGFAGVTPQQHANTESYRVSIRNGLLYDSRGDLLDTEKLFGSQGQPALYVMDEMGRIYVGPNELGIFHHTSFFGVRPLASPGEIRARNGVLTLVTDQSGHFKPEVHYTLQFLNELATQHVDLSNTLTKLFTGDFKFSPFLMATDLLKYGEGIKGQKQLIADRAIWIWQNHILPDDPAAKQRHLRGLAGWVGVDSSDFFKSILPAITMEEQISIAQGLQNRQEPWSPGMWELIQNLIENGLTPRRNNIHDLVAQLSGHAPSGDDDTLSAKQRAVQALASQTKWPNWVWSLAFSTSKEIRWPVYEVFTQHAQSQPLPEYFLRAAVTKLDDGLILEILGGQTELPPYIVKQVETEIRRCIQDNKCRPPIRAIQRLAQLPDSMVEAIADLLRAKNIPSLGDIGRLLQNRTVLPSTILEAYAVPLSIKFNTLLGQSTGAHLNSPLDVAYANGVSELVTALQGRAEIMAPLKNLLNKQVVDMIRFGGTKHMAILCAWMSFYRGSQWPENLIPVVSHLLYSPQSVDSHDLSMVLSELSEHKFIPAEVLRNLPRLLSLSPGPKQIALLSGLRNLTHWPEEIFSEMHKLFANASAELLNAWVETVLTRTEWPAQIQLDLISASYQKELSPENRQQIELRLLTPKPSLATLLKLKCAVALTQSQSVFRRLDR